MRHCYSCDIFHSLESPAVYAVLLNVRLRDVTKKEGWCICSSLDRHFSSSSYLIQFWSCDWLQIQVGSEPSLC